MNRNLLTGLIVAFERHHAWDQRVEGEVTSEAHVPAWVKLRSALANDDFASLHDLSAVALHAEHLRVRIASVSSTTTGFFVCHYLSPEGPSGPEKLEFEKV
jgi:hypothetical protein